MALPPRDGLAPSPALDSRGAFRTDWTALVVALVVPCAVLHFSVVRPTNARLAQMRSQVARLENSIQALHDAESGAREATGLLAALADQEGSLADARATLQSAEATLARFGEFEQRLADASQTLDRVERAACGIEDQATLVAERVDVQSRSLAKADASLAELAEVPDRIDAAIVRAERAAPAIAQIEALRDQLARSADISKQAIKTSGQVLAHQEQLVRDTKRIASARETLESLAQLEERLNSPLMAVAASHQRLDDLLRLKEALIAQTADLPDAFDTLELMVDLGADMRQASGVLVNAQKLLADLMLLEPSLARIADAVEPAVRQSTIGALGGSELRLVLRELHKRHAAAREGLDSTAIAARAEEEKLKRE